MKKGKIEQTLKAIGLRSCPPKNSSEFSSDVS